jgi:probable HAF family extracellular repeat protein
MRTDVLLYVTLLFFSLSASLCQAEDLTCHTALGTLGGNNSVARGINETGQIVGWSHTSDGDWHAFLWQNGEGMQDLGTLGGNNSEAFGINEAGQIVGVSHISISSDEFHAFSTSRCTRGLPWLMLLLD